MAAWNSFQYLNMLHALGDGEAQLDMVTRMMRESLDWLWDAVVAPVLDVLGHTAEPAAGDAWPRVWWCPTGPLTFLPFHAAGRYLPDARAGECALDRVVSLTCDAPHPVSASEGAKRLGFAPEKRRMLVVAMPQTPGSAPLPDAEEDIASVTAVFPDRTTSRRRAEATRTRCAGPSTSTVGCTSPATATWTHPPAAAVLPLHDVLTVPPGRAAPSPRRSVAFLSQLFEPRSCCCAAARTQAENHTPPDVLPGR
ncbi:CHAT domain-containing protein [Streptomyces sp. DHE17-7]|nr:CHAT domain-containing protein [Streptomyces sp. DHE17-7]